MSVCGWGLCWNMCVRSSHESLNYIMIIIKVVFRISVYIWFLFKLSMSSKYIRGFLFKEITENVCSNLWYTLSFFGFHFVFLKSTIFVLLEFLGFYSDYGWWFNYPPDVQVFYLLLLYYFIRERKMSYNLSLWYSFLLRRNGKVW